ncbi:MAG: Flp pilus assembly complex ATPase component TadA, partial [Candidatus Marsarchaeota archaeon]|nr:Flp pilus assembly complex ATPase component TadA [Candidatus Marsarchaeota archaeon]
MASSDASSLGWSIRPGKGLADAKLPRLSDDEQAFVLALARSFREWSKHHDLSSPADARAETERLLDAQADAQELELDDDQRKYLLSAALAHLAGFAPLDNFLTDHSLEEVAVIGLNRPVYVYRRKGGWEATNASITSLEHLIHLINKMARPLGRRVSAESPRINALLPDGSRLHASIPPLSGGEITIRRHAVRAWSAADLLASGSINAEALALLWLAFQSDSSVLVAGNTASGKTTLLDALLGFVPLGERVLVIEETPELRPPHQHCVHLVCNSELNVSMAELVRDSLRMRPDRVVVGEVRTPPEAQAYMETLLSGQARGSYATFHAQSAHEALRRLSNLGASADDLASLDFIVLQRRIAHYNPKTRSSQELRRCLGIWMLEEGKEKSSLSPSALMLYDSKSDSLKPTPALSRGLERLALKMGLSF